MTPSELTAYLSFAIPKQFNVLVTGKPGIGKTDIIKQVATNIGYKSIISHPVVSDPTDYKGLPYPNSNGTADFLPFGDLYQLTSTSEPTLFFLDDLGQAPAAVQAAIMQLVLARCINGHMISDLVAFVAATNRRQDRAGVAGLLNPVKSRFSIVSLEIIAEDWVGWALKNNMPIELIAFIRFKPQLLEESDSSPDIVNSVSPRTLASVGKQQNAGIPPNLEKKMFEAAAGTAFAIEYAEFLNVCRELPSIDQIILHPNTTRVPSDLGAQYAISCALGRALSDMNIGPICAYLDRLPKELSVASMKDATARNPQLFNNKEFIRWALDKQSLLRA